MIRTSKFFLWLVCFVATLSLAWLSKDLMQEKLYTSLCLILSLGLHKELKAGIKHKTKAI